MADFKIAFKRTGGFEGGWVNDPNDSGKETAFGISRRYHPTWAGWRIVDEQKQKANFPRNLSQRKHELDPLIERFYRENFWNPIWGDKIRIQEVANTVYDFGVNAGVSKSIRINEKQFGLPETGRMSYPLLFKFNMIKK